MEGKYIELTLEEYNAIMEAREEMSINEFKSDIDYANTTKRAAELASNQHNRIPKSWKSGSERIRDTGYNSDLKDVRDQYAQAAKNGKKVSSNTVRINKSDHDKNNKKLKDAIINRNIERSGLKNSNDRKRERKSVKESVIELTKEEYNAIMEARKELE